MTFSIPPKDTLFYHSRNDLTIMQINMSKKTKSTSRSAKTRQTTKPQAHQNGWHQFASPIPQVTPINHNWWEKQGRCEPQTCLYPSPVNGTTWCNCQPRLTSLPGPLSNSKHWAVSTGLWEEEGRKGKSRKIRKGGVGRTFHSAGQCIQGDSCHRSAGHQTPDSRWGRICTDRGPHTLWRCLFWPVIHLIKGVYQLLHCTQFTLPNLPLNGVVKGNLHRLNKTDTNWKDFKTWTHWLLEAVPGQGQGWQAWKPPVTGFP